MAKIPEEIVAEAKAWWTTDIIDIHPGEIKLRGYQIQDLIGQVSASRR
jgi:citrate synthase